MKNLQIENICKPEKTGGLVNILHSILEKLWIILRFAEQFLGV